MSNMTDEELNRDWKPNGRRPQSTIARSFSAELMDIFRIENSVADLDEQVDRRKQQLNSQTSELEALEARIREMEQRLAQSSSSPNSSLNARLAHAHAQHRDQTAAINSQRGQTYNNDGSSSSNRQRRSPIAGVFPAPQHEQEQQEQDRSDMPPPLPEKDHARPTRGGDKYGSGSRPGTARQSQQAVPGALPPTPTSSDGENDD